MAESIENKRSHISGGVNTSNNATFRLFDLKSNLMFLLRKIRNTILRHAEFVSASNVTETLKRVQGDIKIEHKTFGHSELGSESRDVETKKRVQGDKILKKAFAFTLAETLIVMGIIGVVAALTIPNLNSSTADKEKVAKLNKIYSNLNDAVGRAQAVYGPVEEWLSGKTAEQKNLIFYERMSEFMKVQKTCAPNTAGCFTKRQGNALKSGFYVTDTPQAFYQVILADGTSVSFFPYGSDNYCQEDGCYNFYVDIDGPTKGSFTYGKDLFVFVGGSKDGLISSWASSNATLRSNCFKFGNTCSSWVIQNNNMDYIKADSSGKCPSGKVLDWATNTSCK